ALTQNDIRQDMNSLLTGSEARLVGYWRFDEGDGTTTADLSGHGGTGTLTSTNPGQLPGWVPSGAGITTSTEVAPLSSRLLTFSEAIDPATVSTADFALQGPGISGSLPVTSVSGSGSAWTVGFDPIATPGLYTLLVGPQIADLAGN